MPDINVIPEVKPFEGGNATEAGPQVLGEGSVEQPIDASVEASKERASEKFSEILSKVPTTASPTSVVPNVAEVELDAKSVYNETDEESRVTKLLSLVETKGVEYAVKVAIHLNDYYVLDRMHDALASRFYEALVAKGVIRDE
jgi:ATP-dependent 26S proteasome regulatory subunit